MKVSLENGMDGKRTRSFAASGVITGWTTALLKMKEGQHVELYIPNGMGYGSVERDVYSCIFYADIRPSFRKSHPPERTG